MEAEKVKGEPMLRDWMAQLDRQYVRFSDEDFRRVSLTTLEPGQPVVAEFRSKHWRLLREALSSPVREGCRKHYVLEVCHPNLVDGERCRKLYLICTVRKLVELPGLEDIEKLLDSGFNVVSVDVNLDDVTYAVFHLNNGKEKRLHIDRCRWCIDQWMRVRRIDAWSKSQHGAGASRHWGTLKRRETAKAGEVANEIVNTAKKFNAKAIVYEKLSNRFPKKSRDYNYKIHHWYCAKILRYLDNRARWEGLAAFPVPAWGTSTRCPRCHAKLPNPKTKSHKDWQVRRCGACSFTDDRDHIAVHNIAWRFNDKLR